jgi:uncharacterized protein YndB with AHSA1/START domain
MSKPREIRTKIQIEADIDAVWKALTDAQELMRWFPLDARSRPEPGGSIWYSWGPPYEGESQIEIWDPPHRLKLRDQWGGIAPDGQVREVEPGVPARVAMDFTLETDGGETVLRLVHSGFGAGADWDDEFEGTRRGWQQELLGLKHYLEHHAGHDRKSVWARIKVELSREEAWGRLAGRDGLNLPALKDGDSFDLTTSNDERLRGRVVLHRPGEDLVAVLENWNDAFLRISVERSSQPRPHVEPNLWLSTYGLMNFQVMSFQISWTKLLTRLFPQEFKE